LVDYYAPKTGPVVVLDPCAGWGGRLLGTLAIPRTAPVRYVGVDPNGVMQSAYERLTFRITHYLRNESSLGKRDASVAQLPFEDWLTTAEAKRLRGKVDIAITSPPYGIGTEIYQVEDDIPQHKRTQSANRYTTYEAWIDGFLRPMCDGVAVMLTPGGVFVLNIANVRAKAPRLEDHANTLLKDAGLVREKDLWKLAMARAVGTQAKDPKHTVIVDGVAYRYEPCFVWRKPEGWKPRRGRSGSKLRQNDDGRISVSRRVSDETSTACRNCGAVDGADGMLPASTRGNLQSSIPLHFQRRGQHFFRLRGAGICRHNRSSQRILDQRRRGFSGKRD